MGLIKRKLYALGVGNSLRLVKDSELPDYSIQFYDYDKTELSQETFEKIMDIFPNEVMVFKTLNGFSFISLSLINGWKVTKEKASELSNELNEDYTSGMKELVIRIGAKFDRKTHKKVSHKPYFMGMGKLSIEPTMVSECHLNIIKNFNLIPEWVYEYYSNFHTLLSAYIHFFNYYTKYKKWYKNIF
jgi:hypothetical protein